ncbi:MAG: flavodoxin family protein [Sphaerochaetaceae bacterium]|jgi:multimeric flavodoxin WrbA|nr:flavodoxin family protein [Sphaerochaetaceae bacterium]
MSKVLLINGSPHEKGCTYTALSEVIKVLNEKGVETELAWIGTKPIAGCIDCSACRKLGRCVFDDAVNEIARSLDSSDALVVGSPVYYAGPSGQLCCLLDRLFHCYGSHLKGKIGAAVVSCRRAGGASAFDRLNKYFTISSMIVPGSQYWNQVHGYTPEDVAKDEEGLQTMRTLAQNIAFLLEADQKRIKPMPESPRMWTNYI